MTFRTRMAFMVIIMLLGCVFAAPFYQSALSDSQQVADSDASPPTLQIQRTDAPLQVEMRSEGKTPNTLSIKPGSKTGSPASAVGRQAAAERRSNPTSATRVSAISAVPIPALELPPAPPVGARQVEPKLPPATPPVVQQAQATKSTPGMHPEAEQAPSRGIRHSEDLAMASGSQKPRRTLKPVRLVGVDIGSKFQGDRGAFPPRPDGPSVAPAPSRRIDRPAGHMDASVTPTDHVTPLRRIDGAASQQLSVRRGRLEPVHSPQASQHGRSKRTPLEPVGGKGEKEKQQWHRIARFDSLQKLSSKYYGVPDYHLQIFEANRQLLVSPEILPIGSELVIPDLETVRAKRERANNRQTLERLVPVHAPQTPIGRSSIPVGISPAPVIPPPNAAGWRRAP